MRRDESMDLMKTVLVVFMIIAHVIQFFPCGRVAHIFSDYVNLTMFSGFMFSFGYSCNVAYLSCKADKKLWKRLMRKMVKTILVFYCSAIAYTYFVANSLNLQSLLRIVMFRTIPGYSEFIVSFAVVYPLVFLLAKTHDIWKTSTCLVILVGVSLLLTQMDYGKISTPILGTVIGISSMPSFPVLLYLSYFVGGIYFSKTQKILNYPILFFSFVGTLLFLFYCLKTSSLPERFPPSFTWIVGGYGPVYTYFIVSKKVKKTGWSRALSVPGRNSLIFLLISNSLIFLSFSMYRQQYDKMSTINQKLFCLGMIISSLMIPTLVSFFSEHYRFNKGFCNNKTV